MPKKKGRSIDFDEVVRSFLLQHDIPTRQDIERLAAKIDRVEKMISHLESGGKSAAAGFQSAGTSRQTTAAGVVLETIRDFKKGADFAQIKEKTGFEDKKLRNIIFRLNKIGKIKRVSRGIYVDV